MFFCILSSQLDKWIKKAYTIFMKQNFERLMTEQLQNVEKGTRLLLHSCCAPCSSTCLERLKEYFSITVLYYNPNIDEREEYEKRKAEQIRFLRETGWADFLDCDHDAEAFAKMAKGLEEEPERGKRCYLCYALRLEKTAEIAKANGYGWFATTLTLSPHKNAEWLSPVIGSAVTPNASARSSRNCPSWQSLQMRKTTSTAASTASKKFKNYRLRNAQADFYSPKYSLI